MKSTLCLSLWSVLDSPRGLPYCKTVVKPNAYTYANYYFNYILCLRFKATGFWVIKSNKLLPFLGSSPTLKKSVTKRLDTAPPYVVVCVFYLRFITGVASEICRDLFLQTYILSEVLVKVDSGWHFVVSFHRKRRRRQSGRSLTRQLYKVVLSSLDEVGFVFSSRVLKTRMKLTS